jgi:tetratricopeptide (TPR) repeat protein
MDPTVHPARIHLGMALEALGRIEEAIEQFSRDFSEDSESAGCVGHAYAASGRTAGARRVLEQMEELSSKLYISPFDRAVVHAGLGDREAALQWLEKAAEERVPDVLVLRLDPRLAELEGEPRFEALARRIGLPPIPEGVP